MSDVSSEAVEAAVWAVPREAIEVGAAAVEAAASVLRDNKTFRPCDSGCQCEDDVADSRAVAEDMLTAALPYLAAHQPARVVPSAEEVARGMWAHEYPHEPWPVEDDPDSNRYRSAYLARGRAVLALFASQPTVAEVLEPVQALVDGRSDIGQPFKPPNMTTRVIHRGDVATALERARTVARTETKGGE